MVTVETFVEFIRKKDVGRIRFAIRETLYDLDATDEVQQFYQDSRLVSLRHCLQCSFTAYRTKTVNRNVYRRGGVFCRSFCPFHSFPFPPLPFSLSFSPFSRLEVAPDVQLRG